MTNQINRAVLSITNNIAEGSEYNNNAQFIRFLKYSKGSCGEVRNMLNLCWMLYEEDTTDLINDCKIIQNNCQNLLIICLKLIIKSETNFLII